MRYSAKDATPQLLAELADKPEDEAARLLSKRKALAELLGDRGWHMTGELVKVGGKNFTARVSELRDDGWDIRSERVSRGTWRYRALTVGGTARVNHVLGNQALGVLYQTLDAAHGIEEGLADEILERLPESWRDELFANDAKQRL